VVTARIRGPLSVVCALAVALVGCSGGGGDDNPFADLSPPPTATAPGTPTASPTSAPASPPGSNVVPRRCSDTVATSVVVGAVGVPLQGSTSYVYAGPVPSSGRTARITCGYGVEPGPDGQPAPKVTLTINGYADGANVRRRLDITVAEAQQRGQQVQALDLDGRSGYVLRDAADVSYIVGDGARTIVVTIVLGLVPAESEHEVLTKLASAMVASGQATPTTN
jgi:hypothetical protein